MKSISRFAVDAISDMPSVAPSSSAKNSGPSPSCMVVGGRGEPHQDRRPSTNSSSISFQMTANVVGDEHAAEVLADDVSRPTPTTSCETNASASPTSATIAHGDVRPRVTKNGVSRTATIVTISHRSATNGRSSFQPRDERQADLARRRGSDVSRQRHRRSQPRHRRRRPC